MAQHLLHRIITSTVDRYETYHRRLCNLLYIPIVDIVPYSVDSTYSLHRVMRQNNISSITHIDRIRVEGRLVSVGDWVIVNSNYHGVRIYGRIAKVFIEGDRRRALIKFRTFEANRGYSCLLYTSPSPRD